MPYFPGSLLRAYVHSDDTSKHYTAVVLKNGNVLEVKNINNDKKQTKFESVEDWCQIRNIPINSLQIDMQNIYKPEIGESLGFNVPRSKHRSYHWPQFCYRIILNFAPYLLHDSELKELYNEMVSLCDKYIDSLYEFVTIETITTDDDLRYAKFIPNPGFEESRVTQSLIKCCDQINAIIIPHVAKMLLLSHSIQSVKHEIKYYSTIIEENQIKIKKLLEQNKKIQENKRGKLSYLNGALRFYEEEFNKLSSISNIKTAQVFANQ